MAKKMYVGVGGKARNVKQIYVGVGGVARKVKKAYIGVNGVARLMYQAGTPIGTLPVGSIVKIKESGAWVDYIIVHQGLPSSMYDASCDGTWVLRKDIAENREWHYAPYNTYANCDIHSILNGTFMTNLETSMQVAIKQVKIPYINGNGYSEVASGANGLSTKIFLLSCYEMGFTSSNNSKIKEDGAKLAYFDYGDDTAANSKRIGYLNGLAVYWWMRSAVGNTGSDVWIATLAGRYNGYGCQSKYGVRPAFVLPTSLRVESGTIVW